MIKKTIISFETTYRSFIAKHPFKFNIKLLIILVIFITIGGFARAEITDKKNKDQIKNTKSALTSSISELGGLLPPLSESISPSPSASPAPRIQPKLVFGIGSEADQAIKSRLATEAPVKMLTSWYNGPNDLPWITNWKNNLIPELYAKGYILHLITFTEKLEGPVVTPNGPACGREYPVSVQIREDMRKLASTFAGNGKLYVTLFTEFQTYPCDDNKWKGNENYYETLKDNYHAIKDIFHQYAPNAKVGISWGGWQSRWDDPGGGGGKSLFPYFADIMNESDITSFQAMESGSNVEDIRNMTRILGAYGKPVILSHYKPDNRSQTTFDADMKAVLTDTFLGDVTSLGLIAMSFMDSENMDQEEKIYQFIKNAVSRYGK